MSMTAQEVVEQLLEGRFSDWVSDTTQFVKDKLTGEDEFGLKKNTEKGWKPKYGAEPHKKYRPVRRDNPPSAQPAKPTRATTWQDE